MSRFILAVDVRRQILRLFRRTGPDRRASPNADLRLQASYRISTSRYGTGALSGSCKTPLGLHRIASKIGAGQPTGAIFQGRVLRGFTWQGHPKALITNRILWLDGLEPGRNRGGNVDSYKRYIYIHGVGDETNLGVPASCGCVEAAAKDLLPLFDQVPLGTLVWIQ